MHIFISPGRQVRVQAGVVASCVFLFFSVGMLAQSTPGTGAIRGVVTDQTGAAVAGASISITNNATGGKFVTSTSSSGDYSSGPLLPGYYTVQVTAKGFNPAELDAAVHVAVISPGDMKLQAGTQKQPAKLPPTTLVNTQQPTVQTELAESLVEDLPVNGRSYLGLAQFSPGTQFLDAGALAPGKLGLSTVSINSQSGRSVRYEVDGVSISDEIAGTTTQNIPATAIQEFNVSRSTLDLPTELTTAGSVNVATRSGGNDLHAELFGLFRPNQLAAKLPASPTQSFQREQYGARVGGALIRDKVFWFLSGERIQQNLTASEPFILPFKTMGDTLSRPFRDLQGDARLDWQRRDNAHAFYRFSFNQVSQVGPFGAASSLQGLREATHTPSHTLGYDFSRGPYTHSLRFEYLRMSTGTGDDTAGIPAGVNNPIPGLGISIGAPVAGNCGLSDGAGAYCGGASPFTPQVTIQSNYEVRYDGSRPIWGAHVLRYGGAFTRIHGGGFDARFTNPQVGTTQICLPGTSVFTCLTSADPTAYPADSVILGNGSGFSSAQSAFGFSGGGLGPDNRIEAYLGDTWRYKPNLMVTYGVRYTRETNRADRNLGSVPALNDWLPGLSNSVRNPNLDFAPQLGFAWDVGGAGRTVIRGGAGLYYDSTLWDNMMLDSRSRSTSGLLTYTPQVCAFGGASPFTWPTSLAGATVGSALAGGAATIVNPSTNQVAPTFCGTSIANAASPILRLSRAFQAAAASAGAASPLNPNYVGTTLNASYGNGLAVFSPDFLTPRVLQANIGFQKEISTGMVLSIDYVRTIGDHNLLIVDQNHSGAARSYNFNNALSARNKVETATGCLINGLPTVGEAQCVINKLGSVAAAQAAFSAAGLDSNAVTRGGGPCAFCAFPGVTPFGLNLTGSGGGNGALGTLDTMETIGRSIYSGAQVKLAQRFSSPSNGIRTAELQIAYTYSKFTSQNGDQDIAALAVNNDRPLEFTGPNGMDRKHQISFGGTFEFPALTHVSFFGHFYSPLSQTIELPQLTNGGEIFATDWIGSGLASGAPPEPIPGTGAGQFMRGGNDITTLQQTLSNYNQHFAGTLTPAGHCLVADTSCPGSAPIPVMTTADMAALGWVMPTLPSLPPDAGGFTWFRTFDLKVAWPLKIKDRFEFEPSVSVFNILNFANTFLPGNLTGAALYPGPNPTLAPNGVLSGNVTGGTVGPAQAPFRASLQSGTFAAGAPRQIEFGLRISF
jgi:hypothetical protein